MAENEKKTTEVLDKIEFWINFNPVESGLIMLSNVKAKARPGHRRKPKTKPAFIPVALSRLLCGTL